LDGDGRPVGELPHAQLARGAPELGAVGLPVDYKAAGAADSLAAVAVEGDGVLPFLGELLVEDVEHLQERHFGENAVDRILFKAARFVGAGLAPDLEAELHRASPFPHLLVAAL